MKLAAKILLGYMTAEASACPFMDAYPEVVDFFKEMFTPYTWGRLHLTDDSGDPISHIN